MKKNMRIAAMAITFGGCVLSGNALANDGARGTMTFQAALTGSGTCTVQGLDKSYTYPDVTVADIIAAGNNNKSISIPAELKMAVVGCPAGVSNVNVKYDYTASKESSRAAATTGTGKGMAVWLYKEGSSAGPSSAVYAGSNFNFTISPDTHEATGLGLKGVLYGSYTPTDTDNTVKAGDFSAVINVTTTVS